MCGKMLPLAIMYIPIGLRNRKIGGTPWLDGQYTVFGEVVEGLDVAQKIDYVRTDDYDRPIDDVKIIRATIVK